MEFTHFDAEGNARMVDVSRKQDTVREATAAGSIFMSSDCFEKVVSGSMANNGSTSGTISTKAGTVTIPAGYTTGGAVSLASSATTDLVAANILSGKTILGVAGSLAMVSVSQDSTTKVLSIS